MPKEPCGACGSLKYHRMRFSYPEGVRVVCCSECGDVPMTPMYDDVYLEPGGGVKTCEHICDPKTGREIPYITKQDKAVAMKIAGIRQAPSAERHHGHRNEEGQHRRTYFFNKG